MKLIRQIAFTFFTNAIILLSAPIRVILLTRSLSIEDYGKLSLLIVTVNLFSYMTTFGLDQYFIGQLPLMRNEDRQTYIKSIFIFSLAVSLVLIAMFFMYSLQWQDIYAKHFLLLSLLMIVSLYSFLTIQYVYSEGQLYKYNILIFLKNVPWILLLAIFYFLNSLTIENILYLWLSCLFGVAVIGSIGLMTKEILKASFSLRKIMKALKYSLPLFPFLVGPLMMVALDRYILAYYFSTIEVALYTVAYMVIDTVFSALGAVSTTVFPHFVKSWKRDNEHNIPNSSQTLQNISLMISLILFFPCAVILLFMGKKIILFIAGSGYVASVTVMQILSVLPLFKIFLVILQQELMVRAKTVVICKSYIFSIILNLILNFTLIPHLGIYGAAIANISAHICILIIIYSALSKLKSFKDIYSGAKSKEIFLYATVGMGLIFIFNTFLETMFAIAIGIATYSLLLIKNKNIKELYQAKLRIT